MIPISRRRFIGASAVGFVTLAAGIPTTAFADELADKQAEATTVASQLADWQSQLNAASDDYYQALDAHDAAVEKMDEAQATIDSDEAQIEALQGHLSTRARSMYRNGSGSFLEVLLSAESFSDFISTWDTLNDLNKDDVDSIDQVKTLQADAEAAHATYSEQEQIAQQKLDEAEQIKSDAEATVGQYQAKVASLDAEVAALVEAQRQAEAAKATQATSEAAYASGTASESGGDNGGGDNGGSRSGASYGSVLDAAASCIGCPYVWGAEGPNAFDCSGFVLWCYAQVGISLDHFSGSQGFVGPTYPVSEAQPGDILWMSGHVGIYAGGGSSIEAMDEDHGVCYGNAWRFDHATHP